MSKYIHEENIHNSGASEIIVPHVLNLLDINSVVDFGCGLGNFIKTFKDHGVNEILGLDGPWVEEEKIFNNISRNEFVVADLESPIKLDKKYDLGICLEVAEHLSPEAEQVIVESLVKASDIILFSAAIPEQGGQNHINEQWLSHWARLFAAHQFIPVDILRRKIWSDQRVKWWYRQNITFFVSKDSKLADHRTEALDIIHPELFDQKTDLIKEFQLMVRQLKAKNDKLSEDYLKLKKQTKSTSSIFKLFIKSIFKR